MAEDSMEYTRGLSLPDALSYGQLFAFSGMAGENLHAQDWRGVLTGEPGEIRFAGLQASGCDVLLRFTESAPDYDVVVSDLIAARDGAILVTFADAQTIVGRSDMCPCIRLGSESYAPGARTVSDGVYAYCLAAEQTDEGYSFALCRRADAETAETDAQNALSVDADTLAQQILDWYFACPLCPDPQYEKLWYKCLSVNRAHVFSPQDGFGHFFTSADRLKDAAVHMQDACFHAIAMARFAPDIAKGIVLSVLECQREDGFIPGRVNAQDDACDITFPPVLCAAVWSLFEATGDLDLLRHTAGPLQKYIDWDLQNRRSPNGLMTWHSPSESDMEDAPRFDQTDPLEAVDFSVWIAYELVCMQWIYQALGDHMSALKLGSVHRGIVERINMRLWDRQTHCYYDRTWGGAFRRTLTPASFVPLFAGLCDPRQAHCLIGHLTPLVDYPFPIPSAVDEQGGIFTRERWRGGVWLHDNFFVYVGLQRYGSGKLASDLRKKTLECVNRHFERTGTIPEFYDPLSSDRDGQEPQSPAPVGALTDFNRSACFVELLLFS